MNIPNSKQVSDWDISIARMMYSLGAICLKITLLLLLIFGATTPLYAQISREEVKNQIFTDTLGVKSFQKTELKSNDFYDRIRDSKSGFVRWVSSLLIGSRSSADDATPIPESKINEEYFARFSGMKISEIYINGANIFGQTNDDDLSWLEKTFNKLHIQTKERVLAKNLMFKVGDTINPYRMSINEQFLRDKPYLATAFFLIIPDAKDPNSVDIHLFARDNWSISAGGAWGGEPYGDLYDRNFLGTGNMLKLRYFLKAGNQHHAVQADYTMDNIWGTFARATLQAGVGATNNGIKLMVNRDFILPSDHIWGFHGGYYTQNEGMPTLDTTLAVQTSDWGGHYGYSFNLNKSSNLGLYSIAAISYLDFQGFPSANHGQNPYYASRFNASINIGLSSQRFFQGNMIYGYGRTEDVPYGFKFELIGSWEDNQIYGKRLFMGAEARWGGLTPAGYFDIGAKAGIYHNYQNKRWEQGVVNAYLNYFSPLATLGTINLRQFISVGYTSGYRRFAGEKEALRFDNPGIHGMGTPSRLMASNRLAINSETVLFTPIFLYHFRFAFFAWYDCGLLGEHANVFKNSFAAACGVGVRIKNERLIFNNIQLRFGISLKRLDDSRFNWFQLSNENTLRIQPFTPQTPHPYGFE